LVGLYLIKFFPGFSELFSEIKITTRDFIFLLGPSVIFLILGLLVNDLMDLGDQIYNRTLTTSLEKVLSELIRLPAQTIALAMIVSCWQLYVGVIWLRLHNNFFYTIEEIGRVSNGYNP
jgi:hypothetical protein